MPSAATRMQLVIIILSEVSQTKINTMYHLYVESETWYKWTYLQNRNKFTVTEELWTEVHDIVRETVIKTIPKKKKHKKAKWLYEKALQIAEKRGKSKGKGEKERYTHLNAEFQRTAKRNKKEK